jgi:hypothetical protein
MEFVSFVTLSSSMGHVLLARKLGPMHAAPPDLIKCRLNHYDCSKSLTAKRQVLSLTYVPPRGLHGFSPIPSPNHMKRN